MSESDSNFTRRKVLKGSIAAGVALAMPTLLLRNASAAANYCNMPKGSTVTLGFNVPQTGAYADEGADELRAYKLAVKHLLALTCRKPVLMPTRAQTNCALTSWRSSISMVKVTAV